MQVGHTATLGFKGFIINIVYSCQQKYYVGLLQIYNIAVARRLAGCQRGASGEEGKVLHPESLPDVPNPVQPGN
jgi:hypothetical protein